MKTVFVSFSKHAGLMVNCEASFGMVDKLGKWEEGRQLLGVSVGVSQLEIDQKRCIKKTAYTNVDELVVSNYSKQTTKGILVHLPNREC